MWPTDPDTIARNAIVRAINGAHVGHDTGGSEWFTPRECIDPAGRLTVRPAALAKRCMSWMRDKRKRAQSGVS